jgi:hypothetical protein
MSAFTKQLASFNGLIEGLTTSPPPNLTQIAVGGQTYTVPAFIAKAQAYQVLLAAVPQAAAAHTAAVQAREVAEEAFTTFLDESHLFLKSALGKSNPALTTYGTTPDKVPTPLTAEQLVARAQKAAATRKARGTLGKKQKKAITGATPPAASPAAASPTPAVAPAAK